MIRIETDNKALGTSVTAPLYQSIIEKLISTLLPKDLLEPHLNDDDVHQDDLERFDECLPIFRYSVPDDLDHCASFLFLWKYRPHAFRFAFDLLCRWLSPGRRLNVTTLFGCDLKLPDLSDQVLTVCEIAILPGSDQELSEIRRNASIIESEIKLGVQSRYLAWRILEVKGLNSDEKTLLILEQINFLLKRQPAFFDNDLITEMQHMLVMFRKDFINHHETRYLSRLVSTQYMFRKELWQAVKNNPDERYLKLKLFRARLTEDENPRTVLGILLAVNFLSDNEFFEEKHLLKTVRNYISSVNPVEGAFISHRRGSEKVCTIYMEIEKEDGSTFTAQEMSLLHKELSLDLRDRIEHILHPVFMPRNEEDIIRNILNLSSQIKYVRDLPQVFISFDEQTRDSLLFTVIVVQVCMPGSPTIQELIQYVDTRLEYIHDRCKMVGMLRKKYAKMASVFHVKINKHGLLRRDGSIDLNKGRQIVVDDLAKVIGEFRDFNGGMISKQNEQLCSLRQHLDGKVRFNELLLENFFYSLIPVIMRTVLDVSLLSKLFTMLLEATDEKLFKSSPSTLKTYEEENALLAVVSNEDAKVMEELINISSNLHLGLDQLAHSYVQVYNVPYLCFVYRTSDLAKRQEFLAHLDPKNLVVVQ